jgi:hypothetical protein
MRHIPSHPFTLTLHHLLFILTPENQDGVRAFPQTWKGLTNRKIGLGKFIQIAKRIFLVRPDPRS